jgi:hypothetical protein
MGAVIAGVHDLVGWTPIALDFEADEPWVQWTDLASASFADPFFEDTIRKHVDAPGSRRALSEADALAVVGDRCDVVGPTGFVFHGSRCGSTAFANALAAVRGSVVVREPITLGRALASDPKGEHLDRLAGLVRCLAQRRQPEQRATFIKLSSYSVLFAEALHRAFPDVPSVFVYRDPLEVAVSLFARPPRWAAMFRAGKLRGSAELAVVAGPEELVAHAVASFYRAALACPQLRLVNYSRLPGDCIAMLGAVFGLALHEDDRRRIAEGLATYSKDPGRKAEFRPDTAKKRSEATPALRDAVDRHAQDAYRELERRRLSSAA